MVEMTRAVKQIQLARKDKRKYFYALMDYEQSWKAMMEKTSNQLRLTETKATFHELDDFLECALQEKEKQVNHLEVLENLFVRGLDYATPKAQVSVQTDLSFIHETRPLVSLRQAFSQPSNNEILRLLSPFRLVSLPLPTKAVCLSFQEAKRLFERMQKERTLAIQASQRAAAIGTSSPRPRKRSSFLVNTSDSMDLVSGSASIGMTERAFCEYMVLTLLSEEDDPSRVGSIL